MNTADHDGMPHRNSQAPQQEVLKLQPSFSRLSLDEHGWCPQVAQQPSPNFGPRPAGSQIDLLVLHNVSLPLGVFGTPYVADLFCNRLDLGAHPDFASLQGLEVSAHFFLQRDGNIIQFVSTAQRAWHAGVSALEGRPNCNDYSIGIEIEGSDFVPFEAVQYNRLAELVCCLQKVYPLRVVCGHEHIAPGRKTDPGPCFDWQLCQQTWHSARSSLAADDAGGEQAGGGAQGAIDGGQTGLRFLPLA